MTSKETSKLIENTIQNIRNVCKIDRDNQQICLNKLDDNQIIKIQKIIKTSSLYPRFICKVMGVNYDKIYISKHQYLNTHAKAKNRKIKNDT